MVAQKAVQTDAVSVPVMASAVAVTAAGVDAVEVKAAAQKVVLKRVLKVVRKVATRAVAASAANAALRRVLKVSARTVRPASCANRLVTTIVVTCRPVVRASHETTSALKTVSHASRVQKVRAVSDHAVSAPNAVIAMSVCRAML